MAPPVAAYVSLINGFLNGSVPAAEFERRYIDLFQEQKEPLGRHYRPLEDLFFEVDAYCAYPSIRGPEDIDEATLRVEARKALDAITPSL